jgi:hypothetical protein
MDDASFRGTFSCVADPMSKTTGNLAYPVVESLIGRGTLRFVGLAAAGVLAIAAAGSAAGAVVSFGVERATVTISPPVRYVVAKSTVHGALNGGQFETQRLHVALNETMQGRASGVAKTPAKYATGFVVFNHTCIYVLPNTPCQATPPVHAGNLVWNTKGTMTYALLASVTCFCGESVPVRAYSAGSIGNAAAHAISLYVKPNGFTPFESADNAKPISGGIDATSTPVVMRSDLDRVRPTLKARLNADLKSALRTRAGKLHYITDSPTMRISSDFSAGGRSATFQMMASGSLTATAFADADARSLIAKTLTGEVPSGWRLIAPASIIDYELQAWTAEGDVTITGSADGYMVKQFPTEALPMRLRGLSSHAALEVIQDVARGSTVEIRTAPMSAPWLPLNPDRISVVVVPAVPTN